MTSRSWLDSIPAAQKPLGARRCRTTHTHMRSSSCIVAIDASGQHPFASGGNRAWWHAANLGVKSSHWIAVGVKVGVAHGCAHKIRAPTLNVQLLSHYRGNLVVETVVGPSWQAGGWLVWTLICLAYPPGPSR